VEFVALPPADDVGGSDGVERRPDLVEIGGAHVALATQFGETHPSLLDVHDSPLVAKPIGSETDAAPKPIGLAKLRQ
jgi:hypothetical protein